MTNPTEQPNAAPPETPAPPATEPPALTPETPAAPPATEPPPPPTDPAPPAPEPPEPPAVISDTVPLARLQGVQRQAAQLTNELAAAKAATAALTAELAAAHAAHAAALIDKIKATDAEIVPDMITGDTPEAVQANYATSKSAFASARSAYARSLPVSTAQPSRPTAPQPDTRSPAELIAAGLAAKSLTINN